MAPYTILSLLLLARPAAARTPERRVTIVVRVGDVRGEAILERLARDLGPAPGIRVERIAGGEVSNPILKGRLLGRLDSGGLLVTVGQAATELVLGELDSPRVFFVGGSVVEGRALSAGTASGICSYSVEDLLDAAPRLGRGKLGLITTAGYGWLEKAVRQGARARGLGLVERRVARRRDLPEAVEDLLGSAAVLWIAGDPELARGAGFQYLSEAALSNKVPVIASDAWNVRRGAFAASEARSEAIAGRALAAVRAYLSGGAAGAGAVESAPAGGAVVFNAALAERWNIRSPEGKRWRRVE